MSKNDGGPAWPVIETEPMEVGDGGNYTTIGNTYSHGGVSVRDYFAAKAMQGILCQRQPHTHTSYAERETCIKAACEVAFVYADCMLAERAKERTP